MLNKSRRIREQPIKLAAAIGVLWVAAVSAATLYAREVPAPSDTTAAVFQLPALADAADYAPSRM